MDVEIANTSLILVSIGLFFVIIFHVFTKENKYTHVSINQILTHSCEDSFKLKLIKCFKFPKFYGVIVIYTFTRLVFNCLQIYVPTFILSIHTLPKTFITLVPLIIFCSCFLSSLIIKKISKYIGSMSTFYFGAIIIATGNIFILSNNIYKVWNWVIISILTGVGSSTMLILSLAQITSFSDELKKISAFIIGCASFSDKLFNGLVVHVIQNIKSNV
ncbi:hypothetical protein A3Q56_01318 [Intoshia linei]|uniref:Major facilitator superfamily (MFS) profile domain-containing protein n=1 Tax=Intoshia linei TaxID=1819745 RepID=A0A177BBR0_9BILA|nr:hypothetical protein A3Q56_01318 [Intoshia linei]